MVICENEPAELPKDVVRSTTKLDDDISQFNLNLVSIWEKFELGTSSNNGDTNGIASEPKQSGTTGTVIEKPSINIKQTLLAFEKGSIRNDDEEQDWSDGNGGNQHKQQVHIVDRPKVKKLSNLNGFFDKQNNNHELNGTKQPSSAPVKPLVIRRSESLMMRLKKYESRIAGEDVDEDNDNSDDDVLINNNNNNTTINNNNNNKDEDSISDFTSQSEFGDGEIITEKPCVVMNGVGKKKANARVPKKMPSIDLSSLKNRWESGDINKRRIDLDDDECGDGAGGDNEHNGNSPLIEKHEELCRLRQELARKRSGEAGPVKNIYENAIKKAQLKEKEQALIRRDSSDLSTLTGLSTTEIQQRLLQNSINGNNSTNLANGHNNDACNKDGNNETPNTPNSTKDHFQLNFSKKANKLKERFELGLINNSSHDDSDFSEGDEAPAMTKLEQIRQEKLEELSVFKSGQSEAREARNLFKQIDKQISGVTGEQRQPNLVKPRSFVKSKLPSMRSKLAANGGVNNQPATVSTPPTPTTPTAAAAAVAAPSSALNNNNIHHNQQPQQKTLEQQVEQEAHLQRVEAVQQKCQAEIKPKQKQQHIEEALPVVSPNKQHQPTELKKQHRPASPQQQQQQQHPQKLAESVQKVVQVESLPKQEATVRLEKQSATQAQVKQAQEQQNQRAQQVETRLHLEQVSCPLVSQQKVESQPLRKQRQQSLPQQSKQQYLQQQQQQPELQPRQQRQSDNHLTQKQRQQQLVQLQQSDVNRIPQQQLEQLIQSQPQQQKILENQPISLTNNCKNVNKLKVLQQTN